MEARDLDLAAATPVNHLWPELVERLGSIIAAEQQLEREKSNEIPTPRGSAELPSHGAPAFTSPAGRQAADAVAQASTSTAPAGAAAALEKAHITVQGHGIVSPFEVLRRECAATRAAKHEPVQAASKAPK